MYVVLEFLNVKRSKSSPVIYSFLYSNGTHVRGGLISILGRLRIPDTNFTLSSRMNSPLQYYTFLHIRRGCNHFRL